MPSTDPISAADAALYRAVAVNTGGIAGQVCVADGETIQTGAPGHPEQGTNPEQFLAMAWSTCLGATVISILARSRIEADSRVRVEVELHQQSDGQYFFVPIAYVAIAGLDEARAKRIATLAHHRCPISKLIGSAPQVAVQIEPY
jgi:organic hydroperoxide reductase OsmC/OhrA